MDGVSSSSPATEVSVKDVARALREKLWRSLADIGFRVRTGRAAWRDTRGGTELVEVQLVGASADAVGCTSVSFSAYAAALPSYLLDEHVPRKDGAPRPRYFHCALSKRLTKTLLQPWFHPFAHSRTETRPAMISHRDGLMQVLRRDVHDRPELWFVRADGSNVDECVSDLLAVVTSSALPWLEALRDPRTVIDRMLRGEFNAAPDSPVALAVIRHAKHALDPL